jgi:hypothetical protein
MQATALGLGQRRAFHVDASRIARLPLTVEYFPELSGGAIRTCAHDPDFVAKVERRLGQPIANGFEITKTNVVSSR